MYVCIFNIYIYIYMHTHTHTHIYIHICQCVLGFAGYEVGCSVQSVDVL